MQGLHTVITTMIINLRQIEIVLKMLKREAMNSQAEAMQTVNDGIINKSATSKAKRFLDVVVAILGLLTLSPLLVAIAVAVKISSPGPVLFKQKRNGLHGEPFHIYKFRSMKVHNESGFVTQAKKNDERVTRIGSFIRRSSIDELPQLINVLKGEMSLVGPRPHAIEHDEYYKGKIQEYEKRYYAKPGITGWAQINGMRGETESIDKMQARIDLDLWYAKKWSFWFDLKIIFLTPLKILSPNAY